jgi:UDP-2,4-diacetamido-2,4,6-trideoxy-beta-L-altropyranose hydrolase
MKERFIVIRADASLQIGTGHVMRCLALADELRQHQYTIIFVCRELEGHLIRYIQQRGYEVSTIHSAEPLTINNIEADAALTMQVVDTQSCLPWIIVDHYAVDYRWEEIVKGNGSKLLVIDDLANRYHAADVLLDQNLSPLGVAKYDKLVPPQCRRLVGPAYLLLRPSFYIERQNLRVRDGLINKLLIFFGGSDPTNETVKALYAIKALQLERVGIDVIIGESNGHREEITAICQLLPQAHLHIQIENMAWLISEADFALGAGGVAMWERCYLGLPSAVTIVAENQAESVIQAADLEAIWLTGWHNQINSEQYTDIINRALVSQDKLIVLSQRAIELVESKPGKAMSRLAEVLMENNE